MITGMSLVAERPPNKYHRSVFIRDGLKVNISVCEAENVELITVKFPGVVLHSMYKPPPEQFQLPALGQRNKPHIVIGDFNSHSTLWDTPHQTTVEKELTVTHTQRETAEIIQQFSM